MLGKPARPLRLGFSTWLTLISLLSLLPMLAFSLVVVNRLVAANQEREIAMLQRRTALAAESIGRELERVRTVARVLSLSNVAVRGDFEGLHTLAARVVKADPQIQLIAVVARDGRRVLTTSRPWGDTGATQPLRALEARVIDDDEPLVSPLVPLGRDGAVSIGIAHPLQVEGGERYSLRLAIRLSAIGDVLTSLRWPPDWIAGVVDQRMQIVARSRDVDRYVGQPVTEDVQGHLRASTTGVFSAISKDGIPSLTAASPVPGSGWWVVVGQPEAALRARAREPLVALLTEGLLLAVLCAGAAGFVGHVLTQQVRQVSQGVPNGTSTVREFLQVDARLQQAAAALDTARHDHLTGLPSRSMFAEQAEALMLSVRARPDWQVAALFIDLDDFKPLNDRLGHDAGDRMLAAVADTLRRCTRAGDCLARLGGDEFAVVLAAAAQDLPSISQQVADRIVRDVTALGEGLGCSVGIAIGPADAALKTLLDEADRAMLRAKQAGKQRVEVSVVST